MKHIITTLVFALVLGGISLCCWLKTPATFSESERRLLAEKPEVSVQSVASGEFQKQFELFVVDQFPKRDSFRTLKAIFATNLLAKKDNNGLYAADGHLSKIEYPLHPSMIDYAEEKFNSLYDTYLKDTNVNLYLSLIPDKNYFLAEKNGYPSIDYDAFMNDFKNRLAYMEYIDVVPYLALDDYYKTDSHWKQEKIGDIAAHIAWSMGAEVAGKYTVNTLNYPFCGVYAGQSALPFKPDTIRYLTSDILDACTVSYFDTGKAVSGDIYNMEKAYGKDPYEMFLSGSSALIEIQNPNAISNKELVVFRDSYGSSLVPLLVPGYSKITVVDIRYVQSSVLGAFLQFSDQDVLFLYSTTLINNSMAMR